MGIVPDEEAAVSCRSKGQAEAEERQRPGSAESLPSHIGDAACGEEAVELVASCWRAWQVSSRGTWRALPTVEHMHEDLHLAGE